MTTTSSNPCGRGRAAAGGAAAGAVLVLAAVLVHLLPGPWGLAVVPAAALAAWRAAALATWRAVR